MNLIDKLLNAITMYKVVLYGLSILTGVTILLSLFGLVPYSFGELVFSLILLSVTCYLTNKLFSYLLHVTTNVESAAITTLILFLILSPPASTLELFGFVLTGIIAMASKYILTIANKHIFNPAAIAIVIMSFAGYAGALWWVANPLLLPIVIIIGLLIVRKIRRFSLFLSFLISSTIVFALSLVVKQMFSLNELLSFFTSWPVVFFSTVMLTEPLTTPPTRPLQIAYGTIVGILFASQFHYGPLFATPEMALVIGNIYAYIVSPKQRLVLTLKSLQRLSPNIYHFSFSSEQKLAFLAGQYLEWTLPIEKADSRGNRRYFTIASAPSDSTIDLGIRVSANGSAFKKTLTQMNKDDTIIASQLAGDFTLPIDKKMKLAFIAGGIGITPFRSMVKELLNKNAKRDIVVLYACSNEEDLVYRDIFDEAQTKLGVQVHYILTATDHLPTNWNGQVGRITKEMLQRLIPDYLARTFYISGSGAMVDAYKALLKELKVVNRQIYTDYFPGF